MTAAPQSCSSGRDDLRRKERVSMAREICLHKGENPNGINRRGEEAWEKYEPLAGACIREAERLFALRASPTPQIAGGVREQLRLVCKAGGDLGCSCADRNYQWLDQGCRELIVKAFKNLLNLEAALSPQAQAGETQRCDRCGSSGDTYVLCSGCGALAQAVQEPRKMYDSQTGDHYVIDADGNAYEPASPPAALPAGAREAVIEECAQAAEGPRYQESYRGKAGNNWWHERQKGSDHYYGNGRHDAAAVHKLKTWPEYFNEVLSGRKPFEWRVDDRDFKLGDTLVLQEYIPHPENPGREGKYTGREITKTVSYIFSPWATNKRTVVMGLAMTSTDQS